MFALRSFSSVANRTLHRHLKLQGTSRFFSISSTRRAAEVPDILAPEVKEGLKSSPTFRKFVESPAALAALKELTAVMHKLGVSPVGSNLSSLQMMKLMANPEFRSLAKKLAQELKDAGVDLDSKEVMEDLQSLAKMFPPKK